MKCRLQEFAKNVYGYGELMMIKNYIRVGAKRLGGNGIGSETTMVWPIQTMDSYQCPACK